MYLRNTTKQHQTNLANYCRTGTLVPIKGTNSQNIVQYRRLVYNVIEDSLQNAYPLTYQLLTENEWMQAVTDFFTYHACQSPQVWYMPKEFYQYLIATDDQLLTKYPFLKDLLWFEWIEIQLFMMEDIPIRIHKNGSLLQSKLVLNPEHELLIFNYPVHKKQPKKITPTDKGNYYLIAHRNQNGDVIFTESSLAFIKMIEFIASEPASVNTIIQHFEQTFEIKISSEEKRAITSFFENAYLQQLIIGFKN